MLLESALAIKTAIDGLEKLAQSKAAKDFQLELNNILSTLRDASRDVSAAQVEITHQATTNLALTDKIRDLQSTIDDLQATNRDASEVIEKQREPSVNLAERVDPFVERVMQEINIWDGRMTKAGLCQMLSAQPHEIERALDILRKFDLKQLRFDGTEKLSPKGREYLYEHKLLRLPDSD